jgi:hypothetical protein
MSSSDKNSENIWKRMTSGKEKPRISRSNPLDTS